MTAWHPPQAPTLDDHGYEVHPGWGMISAVRTSHGPAGAVLFDSDIKHQFTVRVTVQPAYRKRDLHHDWIHPSSRDLIEVEMSEAQWASFVSSMNTSGVPCTVRRTETNVNVPGVEFGPRLAESMREVRDAADKAFGDIIDHLDTYEKLTEDPDATAKQKREALASLRARIRNASGNVEFAGKMLNEHAENVVQRSRADIEAMVVQHAERLGIDAPTYGGMLALGASGDDAE